MKERALLQVARMKQTLARDFGLREILVPASSANLIKKIQSRFIILLWNEALQLDGASHMMSFNQSECIISMQSTLKCFLEIGS